MSLEFITFVETLGEDGYWHEVCKDNGFVTGYCSNYDGYITDELFIGLSNIRDGYFSKLFKRKPLEDFSTTVNYKLSMLACLGNNQVYYLTLSEINQFDWSREIYASQLTVSTTFSQVAPDFLTYYVADLASLGAPDHVRMIILKKG